MLTNEQILNCVYIICRTCGVEKQRIPDGMFPDARDIRYRDADGRLWNGKNCGFCDNERKKASQKEQRLQRKIVNQKRRERYAKTGR